MDSIVKRYPIGRSPALLHAPCSELFDQPTGEAFHARISESLRIALFFNPDPGSPPESTP